MFIGKDPLPHIQPIAVDRKRAVFHRIRDQYRDQLFRKLIRAIVVGASCHEPRQPMRFVIGQNEKVGRCLARRIGTAGIQGTVFAKRTRGAKTAIHFVG